MYYVELEGLRGIPPVLAEYIATGGSARVVGTAPLRLSIPAGALGTTVQAVSRLGLRPSRLTVSARPFQAQPVPWPAAAAG